MLVGDGGRMIDYEKLKQEIDKCIHKVNLDLQLCSLHAMKNRMDLSHEYLVDAKNDIQQLEEFFP